MELLGPAYVIVSGTKAGEGAVVTRSATESIHLWTLADTVTVGTPGYVLVTNRDPWGDLDVRTKYGKKCMDEAIAAGNVTFSGLFRVLAAGPTCNDETIYTSLFSAAHNLLESYPTTCLTKDPPRQEQLLLV
eukprot:NODE_22163_length_720_cov_2.497470.p3 GENE.NODE_22163_length_720_cov_2.497470~~NODE_22163_length_720_cov_2.497470.p3  ORF type:complete len:142 (-),score=34.50 NODE_22163_length_720_cov_2.497470:294-689(-)